ncbi:MAG TPA: type II toxin-antitoxin system prevent-host-death family antitoxin [Solirubrobacterales bacterium]|jgi:prevent-host-death family protein
MREIGIRELKADLSALLRAVEAGEQVRITRHGSVVAELVAAGSSPAKERFRELVATGKVTPSSSGKPDRAPSPLRGERSASKLVLAERDEDR